MTPKNTPKQYKATRSRARVCPSCGHFFRDPEPEPALTTHVFACISNENGILQYAGRHPDLADAVTGYAEEVSMPIDERLVDGCTWYEFDVPPKKWADWTGDMGPEDYDALCEAADYTYRDADDAVAEARARLDAAISKLEGMEVSRLKFGGAR